MPATVSGTIAELGEFALIDAVRGLSPSTDAVVVGPGDDSAVVRLASREALVSTDLLVEGRHFRRDWSEAYDVGRKAAAANLADIAAMGGVTVALVVGFAAPGDLEAQWAVDFAAGVADEAAGVGAAVVGGDVSAADQVTIAITALGTAPAHIVRRSGARPGDVVACTGRVGWAAGGFAVLARGFRSPRVLVEAHRRPDPPYASGPQAAVAGATAMIDVSDGLVADVGHIAAASGVAIDLASVSFELPEPLQAVGAALGVDPMRFVLAGGDDHALVATFPSDVLLPEGWTTIGSVLDGTGVTVDGSTYELTGHEHFR